MFRGAGCPLDVYHGRDEDRCGACHCRAGAPAPPPRCWTPGEPLTFGADPRRNPMTALAWQCRCGGSCAVDCGVARKGLVRCRSIHWMRFFRRCKQGLRAIKPPVMGGFFMGADRRSVRARCSAGRGAQIGTWVSMKYSLMASGFSGRASRPLSGLMRTVAIPEGCPPMVGYALQGGSHVVHPDGQCGLATVFPSRLAVVEAAIRWQQIGRIAGGQASI